MVYVSDKNMNIDKSTEGVSGAMISLSFNEKNTLWCSENNEQIN